MKEYYTARSRGGFVLVITEGVNLAPEAVGWWGVPGIFNDDQEAEWRNIVTAVKAAGPSKMCLQLWHEGRQGHSTLANGVTPVSASAVKLDGECHIADFKKVPFETPRPLEIDEIPEVIDLYTKAAVRAINAGFDFVEIHAANGYLVDQFLQSHTNVRTDAYGGSLENRLRFLREVVTAVAAAVGDARVGIRFSPNGAFGGMGHEGSEETFDAALAYVATQNLAYVHLMDGLSFGFHGKGEAYTMARARGIFRKQGNTFTALMANCGHTLESGNALLAAGDADLVAFGRASLNNPDLPKRFEEGRELAPDIPVTLWFRQPTNQSHGYTDVPLTEDQF